MGYCISCNVLLKPVLTECPYCDLSELMEYPPDPQQGNWISMPSVPGIVDARKIGTALSDESIDYYIDQSGEGTHIEVGTEKYDWALEIQKEVIGEPH